MVGELWSRDYTVVKIPFPSRLNSGLFLKSKSKICSMEMAYFSFTVNSFAYKLFPDYHQSHSEKQFLKNLYHTLHTHNFFIPLMYLFSNSACLFYWGAKWGRGGLTIGQSGLRDLLYFEVLSDPCHSDNRVASCKLGELIVNSPRRGEI